MADIERVEQTIRAFLRRAKGAGGDAVDFDRDTSLFADGIGLDSLSTAELSAMLEDDFGTDPFSAGQMPRTIGEILDFYAPRATAPRDDETDAVATA